MQLQPVQTSKTVQHILFLALPVVNPRLLASHSFDVRFPGSRNATKTEWMN
jgi:hypothetical protein